MRYYTTFAITGLATSVAYLISVIVSGKVVFPILVAGTLTLTVAAILTFLKK